MGGLIVCVKYVCSIFGLTSSPKNINSQRIKNSYQEQYTSLNNQFQNKDQMINDSIEDHGLLINNSNERQSHFHIPTKDQSQKPFDMRQQKQNLLKQQQSKSFSISTQSFKITLQPYQKFYQLLQNKTQNLKEKINFSGNMMQLEKNSSNLIIRHQQIGKLNIFVYKFKLQCPYEFYNQMLNDYVLQKKLDNNIDQYKMLQLVSSNLRLNYLSYKKVLIVSPRDFVYVKYSSNQKNQFWDISFSIPWDTFPQKVRGQIVLNCCKVVESNNEIQVQVYTEVDMKLSVSPKITKNQAVNQIKKYVDKCQKYIKQNYNNPLL